jgi:hypothetical protein
MVHCVDCFPHSSRFFVSKRLLLGECCFYTTRVVFLQQRSGFLGFLATWFEKLTKPVLSNFELGTVLDFLKSQVGSSVFKNLGLFDFFQNCFCRLVASQSCR